MSYYIILYHIISYYIILHYIIISICAFVLFSFMRIYIIVTYSWLDIINIKHVHSKIRRFTAKHNPTSDDCELGRNHPALVSWGFCTFAWMPRLERKSRLSLNTSHALSLVLPGIANGLGDTCWVPTLMGLAPKIWANPAAWPLEV